MTELVYLGTVLDLAVVGLMSLALLVRVLMLVEGWNITGGKRVRELALGGIR